MESKGIRILAVKDIQWDTDGEPVDLPSEVYITERYIAKTGEVEHGASEEEVFDMVADWLSDAYGWCVFGFSCEYSEIQPRDLAKLDNVLN